MNRNYKKCRRCGVLWNVSVLNAVPEREYICPECEYREEWRKRHVKGQS